MIFRGMATAAVLAFAFTGSAALAQTPERVTELMNGSAMCSKFKISIKDLASLVGYDLPAVIPDTELGVDRPHHTAKVVNVSNGKMTVEGEVACQPSDQAVPFKAPFNLDPAALRAADKFKCEADVAGQTVSNVSCTTSGTVGQVLARYVDLNGEMTNILNAALKT